MGQAGHLHAHRFRDCVGAALTSARAEGRTSC
ncbi:hypothetical protein SAMN05421874_11535 [Nonomuraea maritima]|uniref:Uncharacterized protein n=1 Tax=Nonomuraea maritima TaxID=683260 RepID=A0A1G9H145_9ACTN|nr:hypothetical protein SAMN05421874_11535 [Nonomuraea maritima]